MHRSSESFAALAAPSPKRRRDLVNPEKSLTATIRPDGAGESGTHFSLCASLQRSRDRSQDAKRSTKLPSIQTTAIDQASRMFNLTTLLAHSSGEWIASDWPVCPMARDCQLRTGWARR